VVIISDTKVMENNDIPPVIIRKDHLRTVICLHLAPRFFLQSKMLFCLFCTFLPPHSPLFSVGNVPIGMMFFTICLMKNIMPDDTCYDLQGRCTDKPEANGIYIKDGKKIVVE